MREIRRRTRVVGAFPDAVAVLEQRDADRNGSAFVFPSDSPSRHVIDPRKSWARVTKAAGLENLRPRDLRRSLGSWQALAGASLQVIGQSLGHRDPKATAVYSRLLMDPVRSSVNGAVQAMLSHAEPKVQTTKKPVWKAKKKAYDGRPKAE